ncbi:hypothetical protein HID58_092814 [Brassica napus]|uniref:Uncharacterized protein n=1 Tax=Brassica napus TaxID=3708 RepID=A0ABQ7XFI3_BRANA|nr:hypothetical protein HID58_092814 [Brassica napus]
MSVYPHDYLFSLRILHNYSERAFLILSHPQIELTLPLFSFHRQKDLYCFGWQSGGLTNQDGSDVILLGGYHF